MSKLNIVASRTFDPKYQHYQPDGTGRDTFVQYNNGGLSTTPKKHNEISLALQAKTKYEHTTFYVSNKN